MKAVIGAIGCGGIARLHFSGFEKAGVTVKWVCDISEAAARPWMDKFGARYTADYRSVIEDPEVNTVDVMAIASVHKAACLAAIAAGKSVICEKTLTENPDDSLEIVRAAEQKRTLFWTSYMKRFLPASEKALELLPSIGRIMTTHIRSYQCWGNLWDRRPKDGFFWTPPGGQSGVVQKYGGGMLVCGGSHILDLLGYFLGRPSRLCASMYKPSDSDFDLQASVLLETANGTVHYEALAHPYHQNGYLRDGWDERVEINGTDGIIEVFTPLWHEGDRKASLLVHYDNRTGNSTEYRFPAVSPFDRAMAFFCRQIEQGSQGAQSRLTGYDVDELIAHIYRSAAEKRALDVQWRI